MMQDLNVAAWSLGVFHDHQVSVVYVCGVSYVNHENIHHLSIPQLLFTKIRGMALHE